jgi:hypothetical protein
VHILEEKKYRLLGLEIYGINSHFLAVNIWYKYTPKKGLEIYGVNSQLMLYLSPNNVPLAHVHPSLPQEIKRDKFFL